MADVAVDLISVLPGEVLPHGGFRRRVVARPLLRARFRLSLLVLQALSLVVLLQLAQPSLLVLCVDLLVVVEQVVPQARRRLMRPHLVLASVAAHRELVYSDKVVPDG